MLDIETDSVTILLIYAEVVILEVVVVTFRGCLMEAMDCPAI